MSRPRRGAARRGRTTPRRPADTEPEGDAPLVEDDGFIQIGDGEDWPAQFGAARLAIP